jgi:hypothetical protein
MKLRIIEEITESGSKERKNKFKIQIKTFWGWKNLQNSDGISYIDIEFVKYKDAEDYMYDKIFRFGETIKNGNLYKYSEYRMYY